MRPKSSVRRRCRNIGASHSCWRQCTIGGSDWLLADIRLKRLCRKIGACNVGASHSCWRQCTVGGNDWLLADVRLKRRGPGELIRQGKRPQLPILMLVLHLLVVLVLLMLLVGMLLMMMILVLGLVLVIPQVCYDPLLWIMFLLSSLSSELPATLGGSVGRIRWMHNDKRWFSLWWGGPVDNRPLDNRLFCSWW